MKIYWKILISYLCVCMVPLLLSLFTCLKLEQNVRETILRDQSRMIDDVWNNLNATIQASYEAERMIAEDAVLKDLAESYSLTKKQRFQQNDLSGLLNAASSRGDSVEVFAYLYRSGQLITGGRSYEPENLEAFLQPLGIGTGDFEGLLLSSEYTKTPAVIGEGEDAYLVVLSYALSRNYREKAACIGMLYPLKEFALLSGDGYYYLRDRDGQFLFGSELCREAFEKDPAGSGEITLTDGDYFHFTIPSDCSGLYYGFLIERSIYLAPLQWSRLQLILEFILFTGVGIVLSVILSRRTFSPYKRMMALLRQSESDSSDGSTRELERSLRRLIEERQMAENQLSSRRQQLHNGMLSGLLTGHSRDLSVLSEYIEDGAPYRVLILFFHDLEKSAFFENVPKKQFAPAADMLFFAVRNLLEELVLEKRNGVSLAMDGFVVMVFQSNETDGQLRTDLEKAISFMEEHLFLSITCCVSGAWGNLEDAPLAYNEAFAMEQASGGGSLRIADKKGALDRDLWQGIQFHTRKKIYVYLVSRPDGIMSLVTGINMFGIK